MENLAWKPSLKPYFAEIILPSNLYDEYIQWIDIIQFRTSYTYIFFVVHNINTTYMSMDEEYLSGHKWNFHYRIHRYILHSTVYVTQNTLV